MYDFREVLGEIRIAAQGKMFSKQSLQKNHVSKHALLEDLVFFSKAKYCLVELKAANKVLLLNLAMLMETYTHDKRVDVNEGLIDF